MPEDSYSILPVLSGKSQHVPLQPAVVHSSSIGYFAIRQGDWKLIEGLGSGGFSVPKQIKQKPGGADAQLFNLKEDPREERDVYSDHPEVVKALRVQLDVIRKTGKRIEQGQGR